MPETGHSRSAEADKRVFGLIGYPLTHSFSEKYFSEKFVREGIKDCRYELFPIKSIDEIKQLLRFSPQIKGLNVTIPYKQDVIKYLHSTVNIPEGIRACNCIRIEDKKLLGYNTDCAGFERSLMPLLHSSHKKALVLGTGGAAEAVCYVLKKLGIPFSQAGRSPAHAAVLRYNEITERRLKDFTIIVNTTPLGMYPETGNCPDIPYNAITSKHLLYDLVYNPAKTVFLQKGEEQGARIKNGEEMLTIQAEESWKIWNR